jgi:hypothetical protein
MKCLNLHRRYNDSEINFRKVAVAAYSGTIIAEREREREREREKKSGSYVFSVCLLL